MTDEQDKAPVTIWLIVKPNGKTETVFADPSPFLEHYPEGTKCYAYERKELV